MSKIFDARKPKNLRNKSTTIALILVLTLTASFVAMSIVEAQFGPPPFEIPDACMQTIISCIQLHFALSASLALFKTEILLKPKQ